MHERNTTDSTDAPRPDERDRERYRELLEELRTIIPGAQVLLAFLLTAPFAARFPEVGHAGRIVFTISLMCAAAAVVLFLAPASYHRIVGHGDRRARLYFGVKTTVTGMALLGLSITCAVFVVMRMLFDAQAAVALAVAVAVIAASAWYLVPTLARWKETGEGRKPDPPV